MEITEKELTDCRLQLQQVEVKNRSLQDTIEGQEKTKRQLEDDLDALNARLAGAAKNSGGTNEEAQQQQQKLIAQLRDQIAQKNGKINELNVLFFI